MELTYDDTLARVRIMQDDLPSDTVDVEKSLDQINWTFVRGGNDKDVSSNAINLDDYEFASGVENFYRINGTSLSVVETTNTSASTPDNAALDITGDIDVRVKVALDDWSNGLVQQLIAKWDGAGNQRSYRFQVAATGALQFSWSTAGTIGIDKTSTASPSFADGEMKWVRATLDVDNGASGNDVNFYTSDNGTSWTQLGATVTTAGVTSIFAGTALLHVGSLSTGGGSTRGVGSYHKAIVMNGIAGTEVANPNFRQNAAVASFADDAGRTWTMNGDAAIVADVIEQDSITPAITSTWLKSIARPFLNREVHVTSWSDIQRQSRAHIHNVIGRRYPVAVTQVRGSRQFEIEVMTRTPAQAEDMDLMLSSGDVLFMHVPLGSNIPQGFYAVGNTNQQRKHGLRQYFTLPMTEVDAPDPSIVGTTVTWTSVLVAYVTWADVVAGEVDWEDLLENIGDPSEVVIP